MLKHYWMEWVDDDGSKIEATRLSVDDLLGDIKLAIGDDWADMPSGTVASIKAGNCGMVDLPHGMLHYGRVA